LDSSAPEVIKDAFGIPGLDFNLPNVIMIALTCAIVFIVVMLFTRNLKMKPTGTQNFIEWVVDFVKGMISDTMDWKTGKVFLPLGLTLILFILTGNVLGLVTTVVIGDVAWWKSPTSDPAVTLTLAGMVVVLAHYYGVKIKGAKEYGKDFFRPIPFIMPFTVIGEFTKTLTLGLRLFGNMYAGGVLTTLILSMAMSGGTTIFILSIFPMMAWQALSLFIAGIQAFIFTMLTMVYLSDKVSDGE